MNSTVPVRRSLKTRITLTTLLIFVASLWSLSFYASSMLRTDMERLLSDQQFSTVSLVADSINEDIRERTKALEAVAADIKPSMLVDPAALETFLKQLPLLRRQFNGGVIAYGLDGTAIVKVPLTAGWISANDRDRESVAAALQHGQASIGQPVMDRTLLAPMFGMNVPIRDPQGTVIGALSGVTNLGMPNFLEKITKNRYGKTGGYVLVAPQHRRVVTATDKRRIMETIPVSGSNPLLDRFVSGYQGSGVTISSHGEEMLASAVGVPLAGWFVVAALPTAEALAPIHVMQQHMLLATILLTLLAGALIWWLLRAQLAPGLAAARTLTRMADTRQSLKPLPITRQDEIGQLLGSFNRLLETLVQREEALRIAAIAFECQEGMIVTDANRIILRTNKSFTRIMGYTSEEVVGRTTEFMRSDRHPPAFYKAAWKTAQREGFWHGEGWHQHKNGAVFPQWMTTTAVKDELGNITHYVLTHIDITSQKRQEAKRLTDEAAHRNMLVREVHHRIKNNLQGIAGLLRQFAQKHPETADLMNQAIGQVQGISVIHGLQGRAITSSVRLCELTGAIADEIQTLWQTPVTVDIPPLWIPCVIAESEAVPLALVLNELMVNAVKHGGKMQGYVRITLRKGAEPDTLHIRITNAGQLAPDYLRSDKPHKGLQLIAALMPRHGASLLREQRGDQVVTLLALGPPVISLDQKQPI